MIWTMPFLPLLSAPDSTTYVLTEYLLHKGITNLEFVHSSLQHLRRGIWFESSDWRKSQTLQSASVRGSCHWANEVFNVISVSNFPTK